MADRAPRADASQFERLEALVRELVGRHAALSSERAQLKARIAEREARIKALDAKLVQSNHARRDAAKRIDELVAQIEGVEAEVARRLSAPAARE
jgi:septal ring factor EnvC (AmiA/AmiB activator)